MKYLKFSIFLLLFLFLISINNLWGASQDCFFYRSLHHTGAGMKNGYDEGFKKILKIPYEKLGCEHCHVKTCDTCHAMKEKAGWVYSTKKVKNIKTCLKCHARAGLSLMMAKKMGIKDVHFSKGMVCSDCHGGMDVHGNGVLPRSMMEKGVIRASCRNCHKTLKKIRAHVVHKGKVSCEACHVYRSIACVNCHMGAFFKTHRKKGNFIPSASWVLLVNYNGKVTTGTAMTIVYKKHKFVTYAPYFTHIVVKKGRSCKECHGNKAINLIKQGKAVPVVSYRNGKIVFWKGVIPVIKGKIKWTYFDKVGNKKWIPLKSNKKEIIQWWYAKPLSEDQIRKLELPFTH